MGIPVKLLHEAVEHVVTVQLKTGELYRGTMTDSQHNWNCGLENVTFTATGGQVSKLEHIFIRGSKIPVRQVVAELVLTGAVYPDDEDNYMIQLKVYTLITRQKLHCSYLNNYISLDP